LFLPIIAYTFSTTKIEIRAKLFLPGSEGVGERRKWREGSEGVGARERNDPNIVCTYE
jgi:hypothetical protein